MQKKRQNRNDSKKKLKWVPREILTGFATGIANGLFGGGGGIIAAFALMRYCGFEPARAHATTIGIIFPLTLVGGVVYAMTDMVAWDVLVWVAPAVLAGSALGALLTGRIPEKWLMRLFSLLILITGAWMLLS